jgi:hypothetical protein
VNRVDDSDNPESGFKSEKEETKELSFRKANTPLDTTGFPSPHCVNAESVKPEIVDSESVELKFNIQGDNCR